MKSHLKSYAAPKSWTLLRKINKFTAKPMPGSHPLERAQPLNLLLKQRGLAKTAREVKRILQDSAVMIDGKTVKNPKTAIGLMDAIHIKPDVYLRGSLDTKGRLVFHEISEDESKKRICMVIGKNVVKKGQIQVSLLGGINLLVERGKYAIGDSIVLETVGKKIIEHLELKNDATVFLLGGRHIGTIGKVVAIEGRKVRCKTDKEEFDTLKKFAFVVGKDKPVLKL